MVHECPIFKAIGRGGKKVDIYRFGILMLSFALGEIIHDSIIPKNFNCEFSDFLQKCFIKDEKNRWSADQLLDHFWIKHPRISELNSPILEEKKEENLEENVENLVEKPLPFYWISSNNQSRLQSEFSFLCNLGKGGFGEVFKGTIHIPRGQK